MLNVKADEVKAMIKDGDERCKAEQVAITAYSNKQAREARLTVRQKWNSDRKKLMSLLAVLEIDEPKEGETDV